MTLAGQEACSDQPEEQMVPVELVLQVLEQVLPAVQAVVALPVAELVPLVLEQLALAELAEPVAQLAAGLVELAGQILRRHLAVVAAG